MNLSRYFLLLVMVSILYGNSSAQKTWNNPAFMSLAEEAEAPGWYTFFDHTQLDARTLFTDHAAAFGLTEKDEMRLRKVEEDRLGITHHRFDQYHNGFKVEGSEMLVHSQEGRAIKANGFLVGALPIVSQPVLTANEAIGIAIEHLNASRYPWDLPGYQESASSVAGPDALGEPTELLITDTDFDRDTRSYRLAYKFDLHTVEPLGQWWVYVDAINGAVVKTLDVLMTIETHGQANTRYSGVQDITTDSVAAGFRLRAFNRGGGIFTYDMNMETDTARAVDFWDGDNYWDNVNSEMDEAATDAHWGSEMTYNYYLQMHNRDSYDDAGGAILSFVHYDSAWFNASWGGRIARYGDGNGRPLTMIDVVSHELTHGVTGFSAGLVYAYESGALNESFSDIFGTAVEFFADSANANWLIGEHLGTPFRSMENPNVRGDPATYLGPLWYNGAGDNGGVHFNSGVQNHWFYLLSEGGSGVNGIGDTFLVQGIGIQKAAQVAYRNLTVYLGSNSQYIDARLGGIQAAEDLFGVCSPEAIAVTNAWHAVGVGAPVLGKNFGVTHIQEIPACGLDNQVEVAIDIGYFGCDSVPPGTRLNVAYFFQGSTQTVVESFTFPNGLSGGQTFTYTFNKKADLSMPGNYGILARTFSADDPYPFDDSSRVITTYNRISVEDKQIDFENNMAALLDTLYLKSRDESRVEVLARASSSGSFGLLMEGGDFDNFGFAGLFRDPYNFNDEFSGFASLCIDASEMSSLEVSFDLQQNFSEYYENNFNFSANGASSLRVLVNGLEVARYQPRTHYDPFVNYTLNLDSLAGTSFSLTFESKCILSQANDPEGQGDWVHLDNINISGDPATTNIEDYLGSAVQLYPNPGNNQVVLSFELRQADSYTYSLLDIAGRELFSQKLRSTPGRQEEQFSVAHLSPGVYLVKIDIKGEQLVKKLVVK